MLFGLLTWAFEEKGFRRLFTSVLGDNTRAIALYLDFGFHLEGRFEKHILREVRRSGGFVLVSLF